MSQATSAVQRNDGAAGEVRLDDAERYIAWRRSSLDATADARRKAERDEDYYNGIQLTAAEAAKLAKRGQPNGVFNHVRRKVDYILGAEKQTRTDPKCYPRTPQETEAAEAFTDALRYAAERTRFAQKKSAVAKNMLINGFGGVYVGVKELPDGKIDVTHEFIPWDRIWSDPHSREADFSDARYVGWDTWYDDDQAAERFPNGGDALDATRAKDDEGGTYDDKPSYLIWSDSKRKRVRVSEILFLERGVWTRACFTLGGEVEAAQPVTYIDENGEPECPLVLASAYVDRECQRHGVVRDLIAIQDEINKRRQKALHAINTRQARVSRGAGVDPKVLERDLARPDKVILADKDEFEILQTNDISSGNLALLQEAKAEMTLAGPNAAMQGKDPRSLSGRAIQAQQQGGMTELAPMLDNLRDWQMRVMRQTKNRIRQFWTEEMWVRVTDDEENTKFVGLNVPITMGEEIVAKIKQEQRQPTQEEAMLLQSPAAGQVVGTRNNIAATDVDIIIDEQPDVVTLQAEVFETLAPLAGVPDSGVTGLDLVLASPLPSRIKKQISQRAEERAKQPPPPDPALEAKMLETKAKLEGDAAKTQADLQMKQMDAASQQQTAALEYQKLEMEFAFKREEMAFERQKWAFEIQKLQMQMDLQRQSAAVQSQANAVRIHEINNPPPAGNA